MNMEDMKKWCGLLWENLWLETAKCLAIGRPDNLIITAWTQEKGQAVVAAIYEYFYENQTTKINDDNNDDDGNSCSLVNVSYKVLDLDDIELIKNSVAE